VRMGPFWGRRRKWTAREKFIVRYARERERRQRMLSLQEPEAYIYHISLEELWEQIGEEQGRIDSAIAAAERAAKYNQCGNFLEAFEVSKTAIYFLERLIKESDEREGEAKLYLGRYLAWHLVLADVYTFKGLALRHLDYHTLAICHYNKSIHISEQLQKNYPGTEEAELSKEFIATACKNCGVALSHLRRPHEALAYCDRGIRLLQEVYSRQLSGREGSGEAEAEGPEILVRAAMAGLGGEGGESGGPTFHTRLDTLLTFITNRFKVLSDLKLWERAVVDLYYVHRTLYLLHHFSNSTTDNNNNNSTNNNNNNKKNNMNVEEVEGLDMEGNMLWEIWEGLCGLVRSLPQRERDTFCALLRASHPVAFRQLARLFLAKYQLSLPPT
jgi:tetratricopeptide (TPR) repeat protein